MSRQGLRPDIINMGIRCLTREELTANGVSSWCVRRIPYHAKVAQDRGNEDDLSLGTCAYHPLGGCLVISAHQAKSHAG